MSAISREGLPLSSRKSKVGPRLEPRSKPND